MQLRVCIFFLFCFWIRSIVRVKILTWQLVPQFHSQPTTMLYYLDYGPIIDDHLRYNDTWYSLLHLQFMCLGFTFMFFISFYNLFLYRLCLIKIFLIYIILQSFFTLITRLYYISMCSIDIFFNWNFRWYFNWSALF